MKPVYIMWTGGVDEAEYSVGVGSVRELLGLAYGTARRQGFLPLPGEIRAFGNWVVPSIPVGSPFWSTYWYMGEGYDPASGRVVGPKLLEAVREEPWQRSTPHYDLAMTEFDLAEREGSKEGEYALGSVLGGIGAIVSVLRVRFALEGERRLLAIRRLVVHHLARAIVAPIASKGDPCAHICALRPAPTVEELARLALEEWERGTLLCQKCQEELLDALLLAEGSPN